MGVSDATDEELRSRVRQQEAVAELGKQALETDDLDRLLQDACVAVRETLDTDCAHVFERIGEDELVLRRGAGWPEEVVESATVATDRDSQAGYTLHAQKPVIIDDLRADERFSASDFLENRDIVSGISVIIGSLEDPWGVLGAHTTEPREFTDDAATFVRSVANILASAIEREHARRELEVEKELKDRILETSPVGITVIDHYGDVAFANELAEEILGRSQDEMQTFEHDDPRWGLTDVEGEPLSAGETPFSRVVETGEPLDGIEIGVERPDGQRVWLTVNGVPLDSEGGTSAVFAITDVTEQRRVEAEFEEMLGRVTDAFYAVDDEFRFTHVNERATELLQRPEEELLGEILWDLYPEAAEIDEVWEAFHTALDEQEPTNYELYYPPLDFWVKANLYPSVTGVSVYFQDITERKERELELERMLDLFEKTEQIANVGGWEIDPETMDVFWTDHIFELLEFPTDEEPPIEEALDMYVEEDRQVVEEEIEEAIQAGDAFDIEARIVTAGGEQRWLRLQGLPETLDGEVVSLRGAAQDITERKKRERELEQYRALTEAARDVIVTIDAESTIRSINPAVSDVFGYDPDELVGTSLTRLMPESFATRHLQGIERYLETGEGKLDWSYAELPGVHADGSEIPLAISFNEVDFQNERYFTGVIRDITEREEREEELEVYETIVKTVNDGIYAVDEDGRFTWANEAYASMTGYTTEELIGEAASAVVDEAVVQRAQEVEAEMRDGSSDSPTMEARIQPADGESFPAEATFALLPERNQRVGVVRDISDRVERERALEASELRYRTLVESFPEGAVALFDEDLRYTTAGGQLLDQLTPEVGDPTGDSILERYPDDIVETIKPHFDAALSGESRSFEIEYHDRHLYAQTLPVKDGEDELFAGMLVVQDVTERKEYERQLEASNERLEQFAYAASHDLQEPLRMISSYLQLLERRYEDALDEEGEEFLEFAVNGAERMSEMIDGLLQYSRVETKGDPLEPVELDAVLDDVRANLTIRIEETDAEISVDPLPRVRGDATQLRQVFQNLLDNAITYAGDEPPVIDISAHREGAAWVISVSDEGIGIDPDDADVIFEVFKRLHTHEEYPGTGIGLALCERIIERHGGEIWVEPEADPGATISFTLFPPKRAD